MFPLKDDNPSASAPLVTVALIVLNALVFVYQISLEVGGAEGARAAQAFVEEFGLVPCRLTGACRVGSEVPAPILTIFTSMFMHGGLFHIGGNMLYLWIFGNNVEDTLGHGRYLLFYLLSGIAAALAQTVVGPSSTVPMIGASGAISAIIGAFALSFGRAKQLTRSARANRWINVAWLLATWVVLQVMFGLLAGAQGYLLATPAHIGGFLAGLLLQRPLLLWQYRNA